MGKKQLQIATALVAAIPLSGGALALFYGARGPLYHLPPGSVTPVLDSNYRFFAGVWLAVGLAAFWLIPNVERHTTLFRVIWGVVFVGGLGRVTSLVAVGPPPPIFAAFILVELLGAPVFIYWQHQVAHSLRSAASASATSSAP